LVLEVRDCYIIEELRREIRDSKDGRYSLRIQCIILKKEEKTKKQIWIF